MKPKVIAHIDMDAFFAAIEQRDNPQLKGKPVVVGADPKSGHGRGVVSTCSYEARRFGIHSAMPISTAYKLCPHAAFLPPHMSKYQSVSDKIFEILYDFTPEVEPVSVDEAFLDLTGSFHFYKTPRDTCLKIKERIKEEVNLTASIGIAPVKFAAKIASDACKPDGLLEITQEKLFDFLWPLAIDKLWGVGPKTKTVLNKMGIRTIGDLAAAPLEKLKETLGENGQDLFDLARGIDERDVFVNDEVKSVSHEHTFDKDISDKEEIYKTLLDLSERVSRRLRKSDLKGKTLTLKIRMQGFNTYTRAFTFGEKTNFADVIYKKAKELFDEFYPPGKKVRLLGVRISNFEELYVQESLFTDEHAQKDEKIHKAVDRIKDKFGEGAIHRGI